jgi:hypothetical protein
MAHHENTHHNSEKPPNHERTTKTVHMLRGLDGNLESINNHFK